MYILYNSYEASRISILGENADARLDARLARNSRFYLRGPNLCKLIVQTLVPYHVVLPLSLA